MEEKKLNEQESLELITRMINQTKQESAIGSGNVFLVWGYLCTFMSLSVFALSFIRKESGWGWLYLAIPLFGFILAGIVARRTSKKYRTPATYQAKSINSIWAVMSGVFAAYAVSCLFHLNEPQSWSGMFLLGLLLPGIGTYCTGVILKENVLQICGIMGCVIGLGFLRDLCCDGPMITLKWPVIMALGMIISLVIPGHVLNYKAKQANS